MTDTKKFSKEVIFPLKNTADSITQTARKTMQEMETKPSSHITPAMVKREAIPNAITSSETSRKIKFYDLRTAYGREMFKRVANYQREHRDEIAKAIRLHKARAKRNRRSAVLDSIWKSNILSNSIYQDYKKALAENKFAHLRVRRDMLSIDRRNHLATTPIDYKVLAILKRRRIDKVDEPWY